MHITNHFNHLDHLDLDHLDHLDHLEHLTNQTISKKNVHRICIVYFVILFKYAFTFEIVGEGSSE